jgi:hypothetical protein
MHVSIYPREANVESVIVRLEDIDIETLKHLGSLEYRMGSHPSITLQYAPNAICVACSTKSRLKVCSCAEPCGLWDECIAAQADAAFNRLTP